MEIPEWLFVTIYVVPLLLLLGASFLLIRSHKKKVAHLIRNASLKGWQSKKPEAPAVLYQFQGNQNGVVWELIGARRFTTGSTSSAVRSSKGASTKWHSDSLKAKDSLTLISPLPKEAALNLSKGRLAGLLMSWVISKMLGDEAKDYADVEPVEVGSPSFMEKFMVLSSDPIEARQFVNETIEGLLLGWSLKYPLKKQPAIIYWTKGLQIRFGETLWDIRFLEEVVRLGTQLVKGGKA